MSDGEINIKSDDDGIHTENSDDDKLGYVYIGGGIINLDVVDDGIHAVSVVQVDDGEINITAGEGIEGTYIQINGGNINIDATYDEMNNGTLTIKVDEGDTDAIDSNGDITINGGTIDITASLPFDYVGEATLNGGKIIINGNEVSEIPASTK